MTYQGRKVVTSGEVFASSDMNSTIDQTVMVFAGTAARGSAIGTASEGMYTYLKDTNDTQFYTGTEWESQFGKGRNPVVNGGFDIWQRGTSLSHTGSSVIYSADRWGIYRSGFASGVTSSRQSSGLTGFQYSMRVQRDSGNTSTAGIFLANAFESVNSIPFAGQTVTISYYVKSGANFSGTTISSNLISGTGTDQTAWAGFTGYTNVTSASHTFGSVFQRFSYTGTVPSNSTQLAVLFSYTPVGTASTNDWFEVTGVQLELGSVATPFNRAGGTIQGELAACQRYYHRFNASSSTTYIGNGWSYTTTGAIIIASLPVAMRTIPTAVDYSGTIKIQQTSNAEYTASSLAMNVAQSSNSVACISVTHGAGSANTFGMMELTAGSYLGFTAEL